MARSFWWTLSAVAAATILLVSRAQAVPISDGSLQLWFDAADAGTLFQDTTGPGSTAAGFGDPIGVWRDKSGLGNHAVVDANDATRRPIYNATALGGLPAVRLDGVNDGLDIANTYSATRPYTYFIVDQYYGAPQGRSVDSRSTNWLIGKWSGGNRFFNGTFVDSGGAAGVNNPVIGTALTSLAPDRAWYFKNSTDSTAGTPGSGANPGLLQIGRGALSEQSAADVAELIAYNRTLNAAERVITENYLSSKWGITISADRYAGDTVGNGVFNQDVFGVGRFESVGANDPPGGAVLAGASAGLELSVSGGLDEGEWALAGHRSPLGGVTGNAANRVFYLDVTDPNNDLALTMTFDLDALGASSLAGSGLQLSYSPDDPNNLLPILGPDSVNGNLFSYALSSALVADGYFGLLTPPLAPEPASLALFGLALSALGGWYWRRRTAAD